jgi:drug/metabolite transporter (DMT)-like permease
MAPIFYVLIAIVGWGVGSFLYKPASAALHPCMIFTVAMCAYLVVTPILWLSVKIDHAVTWSGIIYAFIGSAFMCLGTLGFSYLLRSGSDAGRAIILTSLYPALTLFLSVIFFGESLNTIRVIGIFFALMSFVLLSH